MKRERASTKAASEKPLRKYIAFCLSDTDFGFMVAHPLGVTALQRYGKISQDSRQTAGTLCKRMGNT